ncbi:GNAT family N-acetyltransferase [Streptomyces sp. A5-4]|uniref:GNAT family N-acetyltransferase n=1 Tax=Streptomyces sp. A5-4 TaxID=3384771 RepID=UPI003DAA2ED9
MCLDVTLRPLDELLLGRLLDTATADADPEDVMPEVAGPPGWTPERQAAFSRFHRSRTLTADPEERTYVIVVGDQVVGAARLCPLRDRPGTAEAGVWIGRSHRGGGVGGAVLEQLLDLARTAGFASVFVSTTAGNTAVHRILTAQGVSLTQDGDEVTARMSLDGARRPGAVCSPRVPGAPEKNSDRGAPVVVPAPPPGQPPRDTPPAGDTGSGPLGNHDHPDRHSRRGC